VIAASKKKKDIKKREVEVPAPSTNKKDGASSNIKNPADVEQTNEEQESQEKTKQKSKDQILKEESP